MMPASTREAALGGIGSGARRSKHIGNVEDVLSLDVRVLRRLGVVRAGECMCDTVHWSSSGLHTRSARVRVNLDDIERGGVMTILAHMPDGATNQRIAIEAVPSALGGWRCYFVCPVTARRCEILYYAMGRFASREGQRLSYGVQNMTELSRVRRKIAKLRGRLRGPNVGSQPRGRNRIEIIERLRDVEGQAKLLYLDRLRTTAERSGTRTGPRRSR
jgi:hypothetical protein